MSLKHLKKAERNGTQLNAISFEKQAVTDLGGLAGFGGSQPQTDALPDELRSPRNEVPTV